MFKQIQTFILIFSLVLSNTIPATAQSLGKPLQFNFAESIQNTFDTFAKIIEKKKNQISIDYQDGKIDREEAQQKLANLNENQASFISTLNANLILTIGFVASSIYSLYKHTQHSDKILALDVQETDVKVIDRVHSELKRIQTNRKTIQYEELIKILNEMQSMTIKISHFNATFIGQGIDVFAAAKNDAGFSFQYNQYINEIENLYQSAIKNEWKQEYVILKTFDESLEPLMSNLKNNSTYRKSVSAIEDEMLFNKMQKNKMSKFMVVGILASLITSYFAFEKDLNPDNIEATDYPYPIDSTLQPISNLNSQFKQDLKNELLIPAIVQVNRDLKI